MVKLQIIVVTLLPFCIGQFSIQGPSDGNRRAQGLKYSMAKGVEYTDQSASLGTGGFSIQGPSNGNSDFQIQGATDGNSDFHIQGATDGNSEFQIHGPTDGGSQAFLHNYEANQEEPRQDVHQGRAIEYKDPSGHQVNWRSYNRATDSSPTHQQYEKPSSRNVQRRPSHGRAQSHAMTTTMSRAQPQLQYQSPVANINYNPIEKAPPSIQELLQFQAQIPYVNIIPEHLRINALSAAQAQANKFAEEYPKQVLAQQQSARLVIEEAPRSQFRSKPRQQHQPREQQREQMRERRQALDYSEYQQQKQEQQYPVSVPKNYRRISQSPSETIPQYSKNVPQQIQEILQFQAQIPFDIIANQISYRPGKPYIPLPIQHSTPNSVQIQPIPAQYKLQPNDYQQLYNKGHHVGYYQQQRLQPNHGQLRYNPYYNNQQRSTSTPVNEKQY